MEPGLYVVATPIGNLEDVTLRALRVLREADIVLCEDTRHTQILLAHHGIERRLVSCHEHNEGARVAMVVDAVRDGRSVALVSDAGTPAISDPGFQLVRAVREAGLNVVPIPGACAATTALSASGLATDRFTFVGFPPKKPGARRKQLAELGAESGTLVLYLAAREVPDLLEDLVSGRADPSCVIYRELTKHFEEFQRGRASALLADWSTNPRKGEVVLLVERAEEREWTDEQLQALLETMDIPAVVALTGVSKRRVYQLNIAVRE